MTRKGPVHELLTAVLQAVERAGIIYCLLRDADRLDELDSGAEVDLLVLPTQLERLARVLSRAGFVQLPEWGHAPHRFFVLYDSPSDCWLKLDVVTEVAYRDRRRSLRTSAGEDCLAHRQRCDAFFAPSPEDELVTLVLHCVVDKRDFSFARRRRLKSLRAQIAGGRYLDSRLARYWPEQSWSELAGRIDRDDWVALLSARGQIVGHLAQDQRYGAALRALRSRALRKLHRAFRFVRPAAPALALLAPDGAGKSSLARGLCGHFFCPVHAAYMGLYGKESAGARRHRSIPGTGLVKLMLVQWRRYISARYHQADGQPVIFDRYTYDALLPRAHASRRGRARRWVLAHACPAPDLVVLLDAPSDVLYARKGEHSAAALESQRQAYLQICTRPRRAVVVDATRSADELRRQVTTLLWNEYRHKRRLRPQTIVRLRRGPIVADLT
jgi:hypothetical protein